MINKPKHQQAFVISDRKFAKKKLTHKPARSDRGTSNDENSLVKRTADTLREEILRAAQKGRVFLGSETELLSRLGVSRPTFRQAARLLQHEELLLVKRGVNGGFFVRTPSEQVIVRIAGFLLSAKGTTLSQINAACGPLITEALICIAKNVDLEVRRRVQIFWRDASARKMDLEFDAHARVRLALDFERLIGELCGNPALTMMLNVMREIIRSHRYDYFDMNFQRITEYLSFIEKAATAVLDGDVDICRVVSQRFFAKADSWFAAED